MEHKNPLLGLLFVTLSMTASADPMLYYKIIPHASGSTCAGALDNLVSTQLYSGTGANGVPTVTDRSMNYAVESMAEATQLCASISGIAVPIATQGTADAANYALGAHPWTRSDAPVIEDDGRCASNAGTADDGTALPASSYYTYLELNGTCLSSADFNSPPADPRE